jgi:hypothetical protein
LVGRRAICYAVSVILRMYVGIQQNALTVNGICIWNGSHMHFAAAENLR